MGGQGPKNQHEAVKCRICGSTTASEYDSTKLDRDYFCYGCGEIVCERHESPWGQHRVEDHRDKGDEE